MTSHPMFPHRKKHMNKPIKIMWFSLASIATLLFAWACSPISTTTPIPPAAVSSVSGPTTAAGSTPVSITQPSQPNPQNAATARPAAADKNQSAPPASGPLALRVVSPQDGAIVSAPQIQVNGLAAPGEVVTVNDNILLVGSDGRFQTTISLDQGPNLIEVIASNNAGAETSVELTVTYQP